LFCCVGRLWVGGGFGLLWGLVVGGGFGEWGVLGLGVDLGWFLCCMYVVVGGGFCGLVGLSSSVGFEVGLGLGVVVWLFGMCCWGWVGWVLWGVFGWGGELAV